MAEYIERGQLLADIENTIRISAKDTDSSELRGARKVIDRIKAMPSADVRENVLGYWDIHRGNWADEFECSVCHKISKTGGNYCFNCGTDMREVQDAK